MNIGSVSDRFPQNFIEFVVKLKDMEIHNHLDEEVKVIVTGDERAETFYVKRLNSVELEVQEDEKVFLEEV